LAAGLLAMALCAQSSPQTGINRWGDYRSLGFGIVDHGDLNSHLEIPIFSRHTPGRAQLQLRLEYDSQFWTTPASAWTPGAGWGWHLAQASGQLVQTLHSRVCGFKPHQGLQRSVTYDFIEPDGTTIPKALTLITSDTCGGGTSSPGDYPVSDGKGFTLVADNNLQVTAHAANGDTVAGPNGFVDRDGNASNATTVSGVTTFTDPLGTAVTETGSATPGGAETFSYSGPNGSTGQVLEQFESVAVSTSFGCSGKSEWAGSATVPSELDLPDGSRYQFQYDGAGRLSKVTLPTGAAISYAYSLDCADAGNQQLTRTVSGVDSAGAWTWTRSQQGGGAVLTTETDPYGNQSQVNYAAFNGPPSAVTAWQGAAGSGTELRAVSIASTSNGGGISQQQTTTEVFQGGNRWAMNITAFDSFGATTTSSDYDWNTSPAQGVLLRQTVANFSTVNGYIDQENYVTVSDNSGQVAKTTFGYDPNGNIASEGRWQSPTAFLSKSFTYAANGNLLTATDVNNAVTQYTNNACGGAFPSQITSPIAAVNASMTWDCVGGVLLSSTDANGHATTFSYQDPSHTWRLSSVYHAADATTTTYSYLSPNQVEASTPFNGGASASDVVTTLDGLGRAMLSQRRQAPGSANFDSVQTTFDAMDRPVGVSMPYSETLGQGPGAGVASTSTSFDALSRPLLVTDGGGGTASYSYSMNDVLATAGPAPGSAKQEEFDGLGRLSSVCELTAQPGNGACGQSSGQTGYWTVYGRNGVGAIISVSQNAQSGTPQVRSFAVDGLGRTTSESNPESGSTQYFYDSDSACGLTSNGDLVRRVDASGNTSCYAHDALHRVTQVSYPSGPNASATPTKTFVFDAATVDGVAMQNVAGKLAEAYTGSRLTDLGFSYPAANGAEEADWYQQSPSTGGSWLVSKLQQTPGGAPLSLALPQLATVSYSLDGEGRPVGASNPSTLASAGVYSPLGLTSLSLGSGDSDTYAFDPATGRMTGYDFLVAGAHDTGTLTWNGSGTLAKLVIGDGVAGTSDSQTCNYSHDDLGRLSEANCSPMLDISPSFDVFGDLTKNSAPPYGDNPAFGSNRIVSNNGISATSDADGNLLDDPIIPASGVNSFDAEGRPVKLENVAVTFDALGRAIEAGGNVFIYSPSGAKLAVMQGTSARRADIPLPGGGSAVFVGGALSFYRHADWQGSSRLASRANGTGMYSSTAYTPYGVPYAEAGTADRSFTGMEQDIASGTYDFAFREYSPAQGRWWTPDPAGGAAADPNNPQSWNRFGYVGGNPLEMVDPLGLDQCMDQHGTVVHLDKKECIGSGDTFMLSNATVSVTDTPDDIALQEAAIAEVLQFSSDIADLGNNMFGNGPSPFDSIGPYTPPIGRCLSQAAIAALLDFTGISALPGANVDDWRWNSATLGFDYVGDGSGFSAGTAATDAIEKGADVVRRSKPAQRYIKAWFKTRGTKLSLGEISRVAGRVGHILTAFDVLSGSANALSTFRQCRGN